ncbi:25-hydroxyvitamin D-1 alpha hydroxylase, mitochondrial-like [Rhinatrema bivittatum]|uniref:25-hydroxyvitamin D-1 alpha hydroxylase, mitochondrial-like n=1 Tax=Rhinatrema bivittatum TaxID=194408 RepID=UPI00112B80B4|nr:25-hydroxyvitamin D-1 alpha hydroxylase, mitochondrial-like [Rhinatrema bivittatum]
MPQTLKLVSKSSLFFRYFPEVWDEVTKRSEAAIKRHRSLTDIPGPSTFSFLADLFCRKGLSRLHELQLEGKAKFGPVWKASFGPILTVHVADPALIEQVLRQEGKHPIRSDLCSWKDYRQCRGHAYGLLTAEGEEWQRLRSILGKHMLKPKEVEAYGGALNSVVTDLIKRLEHQQRQNKSLLVRDIASEFYKFGLEGISSVLFESRIGCLESNVPEETERFIRSINTMFVMTLLTMAMPRFLHRICRKPWQKFCDSWDYMFAFAKGHIDRRMAEVAEKVSRGEKVEGRYLTYYLAQEKLPMKSVYGNVTELLLAGVDTISSTLSWSLYELSRHPLIQTALYHEICEVVQGEPIPSAAHVARMPLLKAVVKEVLRLYPVVPGNARVISDRDIRVGEYTIPKKTLITLCHYATSRDERFFPNPNKFQPERWLRKDESLHPYASIPFGFGKRSCIGRRIAELEVYLALARILIHFEVRPEHQDNIVQPMTRTLLVPEKEINLQFMHR